MEFLVLIRKKTKCASGVHQPCFSCPDCRSHRELLTLLKKKSILSQFTVTRGRDLTKLKASVGWLVQEDSEPFHNLWADQWVGAECAFYFEPAEIVAISTRILPLKRLKKNVGAINDATLELETTKIYFYFPPPKVWPLKRPRIFLWLSSGGW